MTDQQLRKEIQRRINDLNSALNDQEQQRDSLEGQFEAAKALVINTRQTIQRLDSVLDMLKE